MNKGTKTLNGSALAVCASLLMAATAYAATTPAQKCEASKNKTAGKYYSCREKAESTAIKTGLPADYSKCSTKFDGKWDGAETAGAGMCPDNVALTADMNAFLAAQAADAALIIAGGSIPDCAGDLSVCEGDLSTCNGDLGTCASNLSSTNADLGTCTGNLGTCTGSLGTCSSDLSTTNADLTSCAGDLATANTGTAVIGDVLTGKTFTSTAGLGATGTMPNNGGVTLTPGTADQAIASGYHDGTGKCAGDADLVAGNIKNGVNLFGVTGTVSAGGLQESGQTICYNTAGTVIACAGTGQDGELQKGVANSFTDNGDGTITDNLTGLMWEKISDDGTVHDKDNTYTWANAFAGKVATLNSTVFAGHADWRVPNRKELDTLANLGAVNPATFSAFNSACTGGCTVLTCSCTQSDVYWSSTTYQGGPSNAWGVGFGDGDTGADFKTNSYHVRGVRAGS